MSEFLLRRLDQPWAWVVVFGGTGLMGGALAGSLGKLPGGFLGGAAITAAVVGLVGLLFGIGAWLACWFGGGLDKPAKNAHLWARPMRCLGCGWKTEWNAPISRRDCLCPPSACPACKGPLFPWVPDCPRCQASIFKGDGIARDMARLIQWPQSWKQGLWGGYTCRACRCAYDRWGRPW